MTPMPAVPDTAARGPYVRTAGPYAHLLAYVQLARIAQQRAYVYRAGLLFNVASILIQVYLLKVVWTAVYAGRSSVGGLGLLSVAMIKSPVVAKKSLHPLCE